MGLIKNSSIVVFGVVVSNILAYIFHIYVGRALGPSEYGVFGALMAVFLLLALPAQAISSALTKFTSKFNSDKERGNIFYIRKKVAQRVFIYGLIILVLLIAGSKFISSYLEINSVLSIAFVGLTILFGLMLPVNRGVLQGMKKFKAYSANTIIEAGARLVIAVVLIILGFGVNGAILAYGLGYLAAFLLIFPFIREIKENGSSIEMKKVYRFIFLVLIFNVVFQAIINIPSIFIKHYLGAEITGFWTAALTIARISLFVTGGITIAMFPEAAGEKDKNRRKALFIKSLVLTLLSSIFISLCFFIVGKSIVSLLYGNAYLPALPILEWLSLAMIPLSILQLWMNYWLARRN